MRNLSRSTLQERLVNILVCCILKITYLYLVISGIKSQHPTLSVSQIAHFSIIRTRSAIQSFSCTITMNLRTQKPDTNQCGEIIFLQEAQHLDQVLLHDLQPEPANKFIIRHVFFLEKSKIVGKGKYT